MPKGKTAMRTSPGPLVALTFATMLAAVALSGCKTAPAAHAASATLRAALDGFLDYYFHAYRTGLPNEAERAALAPMASATFNAALEQAANAERCAQARHHGTEPPLIQGDLFSSLFEKATAVQGVVVAREEPDRVDYTVAFEYRTPGAPKPEVEWKDIVRLVRNGEVWLVDDVFHGGNWDFSVKGSVKAQLLAVAALCSSP
jgi:hypothetical protein